MNSDFDQRSSFLQILRVFLRLGLTSFGSPVAHLVYLRDEFVARRQWLAESAYAHLVALCQFLPAPASSQVGFSIGLRAFGPLFFWKTPSWLVVILSALAGILVE